MEKTMYKVEFFDRDIPTITPVIVEKEDKDFIWIKDDLYRKYRRSEFTSFFKTYQMAFDFIDDKMRLNAKRANERYASFLEVTPKP